MHSNELICDVLTYIDTFLYTKITIDDLEKKFNYNRYYIMKLFKKEIGITIFDYINKLRIESSINELNNSSHSMLQVAMNNGFYSLEYFSEIFKREIGISPKQYHMIVNHKFIYNDKNQIIIDNILNIKRIISFSNTYMEHRKRSITPVKKMSIFLND